MDNSIFTALRSLVPQSHVLYKAFVSTSVIGSFMPSATQQNALNLIGTSCPMAFVKARMHIDQLPNSAVTVIVFEDTAANEPLIRSIEALGHTVLSKTQFESTDDTVPNSDASSRSGTLHVIRVEIQVKI